MDAQQFAQLMQSLDAQTAFLQDLEQQTATFFEILETQRSIYALVSVGFGMVVAGFLVAIFFLRLR